MASREDPVRSLKVPDIVHQHFGMIHLGAFRLQVGAFDPLHIIAVEDGGHGLDFFQRPTQAFDQRLVQNSRM